MICTPSSRQLRPQTWPTDLPAPADDQSILVLREIAPALGCLKEAMRVHSSKAPAGLPLPVPRPSVPPETSIRSCAAAAVLPEASKALALLKGWRFR